MNSLCIVIPAYNEKDNIKDVISEWHSVLEGKAPGSEIVINCSGSNDGTEEELICLQKKYPSIEIITASANSYGSKVLDLYKYAVNSGCDFVFQTDSDGQTYAEDFEQFWRLRHEYDVLIGSRDNRLDGMTRRLVQMVECVFIKVFFNVSVPDANTPFRLMKTDVLEKYLEIIPLEYSMPNLIMTACFAANRENLKFAPIRFGARQGGTNKMNLKKIFKCGLESIYYFRKTAQLLVAESRKNG